MSLRAPPAPPRPRRAPAPPTRRPRRAPALPTRRPRRTPALAPLLAAAALAPAARAQAPNEADVATARALAVEGARLADAGDCAGAVERYRRAESLFHAPSILVRLAECQIKLGQIVAGTENARRVLREDLGPRPNPRFVEAQRQARELYDANVGKIATLRVRVEPPRAPGLRVRLDGEELGAPAIDVDRPTDPGTHRLAAEAPRHVGARADVDLAPGAREIVTLRLRPEPNAGPADPPSGPRAPGSGPARWPAYVAFGVGGAGLVAGSIFGVLALDARGELERACNGERKCPTSSQSDVDALGRRALLSNLGFGVGVVGLGLGAYLLLAPPGGGARPVGVSVRPWLGPGSGGVVGAF